MRVLLGWLNVVSLLGSIWAFVDIARIPARHWELARVDRPTSAR